MVTTTTKTEAGDLFALLFGEEPSGVYVDPSPSLHSGLKACSGEVETAYDPERQYLVVRETREPVHKMAEGIHTAISPSMEWVTGWWTSDSNGPKYDSREDYP